MNGNIYPTIYRMTVRFINIYIYMYVYGIYFRIYFVTYCPISISRLAAAAEKNKPESDKLILIINFKKDARK